MNPKHQIQVCGKIGCVVVVYGTPQLWYLAAFAVTAFAVPDRICGIWAPVVDCICGGSPLLQ